MTFKQDLQAQRERSAAKFGPDRLAITESETAALTPVIDARDHPRVGDKAPSFVLPDALATPVDLSNRLDNGPVVLNFYRGGWCPYCNIELRAYQALLPRITELGASLVAISPQAPDDALTTAEKNDLTFDVLSDTGSAVAESFGLDFELSEKLQDIYTDLGNDLTAKNAGNDWRLPVPATFVIARDGRIVFAHVDADYRERAEPEQVIEALEILSQASPLPTKP
jgi:peroxiredoxin